MSIHPLASHAFANQFNKVCALRNQFFFVLFCTTVQPFNHDDEDDDEDDNDDIYDNDNDECDSNEGCFNFLHEITYQVMAYSTNICFTTDS